MAASTNIRVFRTRGFKCFKDPEPLEIAPVTLFFGDNNSGKSSLIEALYLPAQTLRSEDPGICLRMFSEETDFGSFTDISFKHNPEQVISFEYQLDHRVPERYRRDVPRQELEPTTVSVDLAYMPVRKEIFVQRLRIGDGSGNHLTIEKRDRWQGTISLSETRLSPELEGRIKKLLRPKNFLYDLALDYRAFRSFRTAVGNDTAEHTFDILAGYAGIIAALRRGLESFYYLGPIREPARRSYVYSGELPVWVGVKGERALQVFSTLRNRKGADDRETVRRVVDDLQRLGFLKNFRVRNLGSTRNFELWTQHADSGLGANLADTGFGASQVVPVVVGIHSSPANATLLIEQPELHLHPVAQAELGRVLADACLLYPEKRFIIESHSETLMLALQTRVAEAESKFSAEHLRVYYIQPKPGGHRIIDLRMDESAVFLEPWPRGFFKDSLREAELLAMARMNKHE